MSIIINIAVLVGGVIMMLPFIWMVSLSFSRSANIALPYPPTLIPEVPSILNYSIILKQVPIARFYFNTMIVSSTTTIFVLFICSLAAYALAKGSLKGRSILFLIVLSTMMVPLETVLIPMYLLMKKLGLYNTLWALILPNVSHAFSVFLIFQYMRNIPNELIDAAKVDGCSPFKIYYLIAMPLSKPILITVGFLTFIWRWNDFLYPLVLINDPAKYTLSLGLACFEEINIAFAGVMMALIVLSVVPLLAIYAFLQKYVVQAVITSGLKG